MNRRLRIMLRWTIAWLPAFLIAWLLDPLVYRLVLDDSKADKDWVELLRQMGYLPTWVIVTVLFWLVDRRSRGARTDGVGGMTCACSLKPSQNSGNRLTIRVFVKLLFTILSRSLSSAAATS